MNISYMEYYIHTANRKSITAAASDLFITPQGLRKALSKVESVYGCKLFEINDSKMILTVEGEIVYAAFCKILDLNNNLRKELFKSQNSAEARGFDFTVLSAPIFMETLIPGMMTQFVRDNPKIKVRITEYSSANRINPTEHQGNMICLFGSTPAKFEALRRKFSDISDYRILLDAPIYACVSANSPLAKRHVLHERDFANRDLVICRHEEYFLKSLNIPLKFSNLAIRASNKATCLSVLSGSPNAIGFINPVEAYYLGTSELIKIPLDPVQKMLYGYLANDIENNSNEIKIFCAMLQKEFGKIQKYENF